MTLSRRCQAESYCKGFPGKCHEYCIGFVQIGNIYAMSNMPSRYQYDMPLTVDDRNEADRHPYLLLRDVMEDVDGWVQRGGGLFIFSERKGNGKTSWACKIMNAFFRKVALGNNLRCRGLFIEVPKFLRDLRSTFDKPSEETAEFLENILTADLVIWDDIGSETPTTWVRETLYTYINHREANGLSQIFTSNLPLERLQSETYLGDRIVSRIAGQSQIIELVGSDRRIGR